MYSSSAKLAWNQSPASGVNVSVWGLLGNPKTPSLHLEDCTKILEWKMTKTVIYERR